MPAFLISPKYLHYWFASQNSNIAKYFEETKSNVIDNANRPVAEGG